MSEQPPEPSTPPPVAAPGTAAPDLPGLDGLGSLATGSVSTAVGFGLGEALHKALAPLETELSQESYSLNPAVALDTGIAARIVAQRLRGKDWGGTEAANSGIAADRFALVHETQLVAPPVGTLVELLRRKEIKPDDFTHGLTKGQYEERWLKALAQLESARLDPAVLALAIVRGIIPDPGILPVGPPTEAGKVPKFPVFKVDAVAEAAAHGIDKERLSVMVGNMGRPASLQEALWAYWRGYTTRTDYLRAVAEGDVRNEWADAIEAASREILTSNQYAESQLRGFQTETQRRKNTAKHGMSTEDSDLLYNVLGRAPAVHTITKGLAHGAAYPGKYANVPEPYRSAIQRGNLREEFSEIAYADRYSWPSAFVLRALTQAGEVSAHRAQQVLEYQGWEPAFAKEVAVGWGSATGSGASSHVTKAQGQVWTALHKSYVNQLSTDKEATTDLEASGVAATDVAAILALWKVERGITRRSLSPAQLKKAATDKLRTKAEATKRLEELGYTKTDIDILFSE